MFDEQVPAERRACTTNSAGCSLRNDAILRNIYFLKSRDKNVRQNSNARCCGDNKSAVDVDDEVMQDKAGSGLGSG